GELALLEAEPELSALIRKISGKKDLKKVRFYRGARMACDICGGTGYNGRIGIFEVMEVSERIRALIAQKTPADMITKAAHEEGMTTMLEDGIEKMLKGMTTLEEVIRATKA
ncbi:MAG TPA: type II/IV secretion system protein, partial [Candidatus Paceibacterota bacterium]|nr:type II/IV secretion system protein [Candidatus Paceibacterota bacterium]